MKKKLVIITLLLGMVMTSLVACNSDKEPKSTEQSSEMVSESEKEDNENPTTLKDAKEIESMTKEEIVEDMMHWVAQLVGFEHIGLNESERKDIETLDNGLATTLAIYHLESYNGFTGLEYNDEIYGYYVSDNLLNQSMKDYFGKEFSVEEYMADETFGYMIREDNGQLLLELGDWGTAYPVFVLESIEELNGINNMTGKVIWEEVEFDTRETIEQVTATISENADSQYGYVIESLTVDYVE